MLKDARDIHAMELSPEQVASNDRNEQRAKLLAHKILDHYGIKYKDLLDKLINLSLKKHSLKTIKNKNSIDILSSIKLD